MSMTTDNFTRELRLLDPLRSGELEGALDTAEAAELLERILSLELEAAAHPRHPGDRFRGPDRNPPGGRWGRRMPRLALAVVAVGAVGILVLLIELPPNRGGKGRLADALDNAAATTISRPAAGMPYTFLKTRELSVNTRDADERSWSVLQSTTREEWVGWNGSGQLRLVTGPPRFVGPGDRAEWEGAGRPSFLTLGFGRRTEERWVAVGLLRSSVEELPADPAALATRLRDEAEADHVPVPAATLQLIAEDLRSPGASPGLRHALYEAAKRVPGIEYLGKTTDPEGRSGIAIGLTSSYSGAPKLYSLIFDPDTAKVLATETTSLAPTGSADSGAPTLLRAMVYLDARPIESTAEFGGTWPSGSEPSTSCGRPSTSFLVYHVTTRNPCSTTLDAALDEGRGAQ